LNLCNNNTRKSHQPVKHFTFAIQTRTYHDDDGGGGDGGGGVGAVAVACNVCMQQHQL
jgi:hypothetical protein